MKKRDSITRSSIKYSYLNGITDAIVKVFTTGPLLTIYAVGIGMSNTNIGFMQSILPFSNLLHLFVARFLEKGYSPRKIAWISSLIARVFLLLIAISVFLKNTTLGICLFVIPYILAHICASITGGAFWPWCKGFVPNRIMVSYFAFRTQYIIAAKMLTFLFATGVIYLIHAYRQALELYCYSLFFVLAFFAGLVCTYALYKVKDVKLKHIYEISFKQKVKVAFANKNFLCLFLGISLANFVLTFYTSFNIVFLLKSLKLTVPIVMCFTLFSNLIEILVAPLWKKYSNIYKSTTLLAYSMIAYVLSIMILIILSLVSIDNNLHLLFLIIVIGIFIGIGSSGFMITTNSISIAYVPQKMSSVYLSLLNIGRFGSNGLGATCGGLLLGYLANNNYKWLIFFCICLFLYFITAVLANKIKPVNHIDLTSITI